MRVALAAPALAVRLGLRALLSAGDSVEVVAEAATLAELLPLPADIDVLLLVADSLPQALPESAPLPILLLVSGAPPGLPELAMLSARPWGLLSLEASAEELSAALTALHEGLFVSSPALVQPYLSPQALEARPLVGNLDETPGGELTEREGEVLGLLAQGLANKQIAARLGISEHTVKFHVSAIYSKLGASSRTEAVRLGVRQGRVVL
jgi:DNA-binding NarL/FixJ family response regulator